MEEQRLTKGDCDVFAGTKAVTDSYVELGSKLVFPIGSANNEAMLKITYNLVDVIGLVAEVALNHDWQSGKHYTYNVDIHATEILLSPSVEDWVDGPAPNVTIPE